jgi:hypothetical protein
MEPLPISNEPSGVETFENRKTFMIVIVFVLAGGVFAIEFCRHFRSLDRKTIE